MSTLLQINSSPRGTSSVSSQLTDEFVATWKQNHPDGQVVVRDLNASGLSLVDTAWIGAAFTPVDARGEEQKAALALSDKLIEELFAADEYVIGVPVYNFSIPAVLKLWIDQIVRAGRTFAYTANGAEGALKGKKATFVIASGGAYQPGTPYAAMNFAEPYLRGIFGFLGITDVSFAWADGLSQTRTGKVDLQEYLKPIRENVRALAAV